MVLNRIKFRIFALNLTEVFYLNTQNYTKMRYSTTRFLLIGGFILFLSIVNSEAIGQVAQGTQTTQKSLSEKDLQEIDEMREMVRERKKHQEEQKQILKDLENAIASFSKETGSVNTAPKATITKTSTSVSQASLPANYYDAGRPGFVTSESVLSRLDAMEQLRAAKTQYEIDIKAAQREIELLRKQLEIANDQIDRYQRAMVQVDEPDNVMPVYEQRTLVQQPNRKSQKVSKKENKKSKKQQPQQEIIFAEPTTNSLNSEKNKQMMEEIEMMKQQLRERRERQAQQQKEMQELLQMAQSK